MSLGSRSQELETNSRWAGILKTVACGRDPKHVYPDPLKDPNMELPKMTPPYYIGETRVLLGGSIFWIL